jgi:hypothetical protein
MYILYNQLPLYVCALWKKNKYSFFLSYIKFSINRHKILKNEFLKVALNHFVHQKT